MKILIQNKLKFIGENNIENHFDLETEGNPLLYKEGGNWEDSFSVNLAKFE
jgi:hypothetical protein